MRINNKIVSKTILEDWYRQHYSSIFRYHDYEIDLKIIEYEILFK